MLVRIAPQKKMTSVKESNNNPEPIDEAHEINPVSPDQSEPKVQGQPRTLKEVEKHFDQLSDITDLVAQINSIYESDIEGNLQTMEDFIYDVMDWDIDILERDARLFYISHMTFHREIVSEIIAEARQVLIDERRSYLKRLVNYYKKFKIWLDRMESEFAA